MCAQPQAYTVSTHSKGAVCAHLKTEHLQLGRPHACGPLTAVFLTVNVGRYHWAAGPGSLVVTVILAAQQIERGCGVHADGIPEGEWTAGADPDPGAADGDIDPMAANTDLPFLPSDFADAAAGHADVMGSNAVNINAPPAPPGAALMLGSYSLKFALGWQCGIAECATMAASVAQELIHLMAFGVL